MTKYTSVVIDGFMSFGGQGHVTEFSAAQGHEIESNWVVVIIRKDGDEVHFPWSRVKDARPVAMPAKNERVEQAWKDSARSPLMPTIDQAFAGMKEAMKRTPEDMEPRTFEEVAKGRQTVTGIERRSGKGPVK